MHLGDPTSTHAPRDSADACSTKNLPHEADADVNQGHKRPDEPEVRTRLAIGTPGRTVRRVGMTVDGYWIEVKG